MHKLLLAAIGSALLICLPLISFSQNYSPGVVRVKFHTNSVNMPSGRLSGNKFGIAALDAVNTQIGVTSVRRVFREAGSFEKAHQKYGLHLWYEIRFAQGTAVNSVLEAYEGLGTFEVVEPLRPYLAVEPVEKKTVNAQQPSALPTPTNDPLFPQQWHYENTGQSGGTSGADISLPQAWATQTGNPDVIVAVIDGGIDILHPDLTASLWVNTDEIPANNIDDDHNGYVDDVNGYGFGDNTGTIYPHYHGTHVAGTIAAVTNNNTGVSGIAGGSGSGNGVRLMSCAGFGSVGIGGFEDAMVYAADNGAVISQNSWRGGSTAIEAAIDYFVARAGYDNSDEHFDDNIQIGPMAGGIVIFAAGNDNTTDPNVGYPASYPPNLAVASTDHRDLKSYFSNFGPWVDIAAPGSDVFSTYPVDMGSYATLSGTSMACPHVSGVAALIISQFKGPSFSPNLVWDRLQFTADDIDDINAGYENMLGSGRVNAYQALQVADDIPPNAITDLAAADAKLTSIVLQWTAPGASGTTGVASYYDMRYSTTPITAANFSAATQVASSPRPKIGGLAETFEVTGLSHSTTYYFAIKAKDFFGNVADISNVVQKATLPPPVIQVSPSSISASLLSGQETTRALTIQNTGGSALNWSIHLTADPSPGSMPESYFKPQKESLTGFNNAGVQVSSSVGQGPYPLAAGDFQTKAPSPTPLTCLAVDPNTGFVYGQGNGDNTFYQYNPATDVWTQLASAPLYSGNNGGATYLNGKIYTVYTENSSELGVYTIADNTWVTITNGLSAGTANICSDGRYLYMVKGYDLRRYDPETNAWNALAPSPFIFEAWGGLSFHGNALYGHQGNSYTGFAKYDIATNVWTSLASVPGGVVLGSAIDRSSGIYYAYGSYGGNNLYAYNIASGLWSVQTISSFYVDDGGLVYVPQAGRSGIYFLQGQSGTGFARYETESFSNWLRADAYFGQIPPSSSQVIQVTLDAGGLYGGTYHGDVNITHNDPVKATVVVPVTLNVTGAPDIELNRTAINYGDVYIGAQRDSVITVINDGTDDLTITGMTIANPNYQIVFTAFTLHPREGKDFNIVFRPTSAGTFNTNLVITSNDPDEASISVPLRGKGLINTFSATPSSISVSLISGQQETRQVTVVNGGTSTVNWSGSVEGTGGNNNLADILSSLTTNIDQVTNIIPNRFDFYDGYFGTTIDDGGGDMYDGGNALTTDVGGDFSYLTYTNGSIQPDTKLGAGGQYFTAKFGGLFVMAADVTINSFTINGNLGADGGGTLDATVLTATHNGKNYKGFVKRVYNAGDPSVNHLIIVEDNGAAGHTYSTSTDSDFHQVTNLTGVKRVYYLLFSAWSGGGYIDNGSVQSIMNAFLNAVNEGVPWLTLAKESGTLGAGASENVSANISALNMDGGVYYAQVLVSDNIPFKQAVSVPVTLTVVGRPDIDLSKSSVDYANVFIGGHADRTVSLKNLGSDMLVVSSIASDNGVFRVSPASVTVNPHDSVRLTIGFYPTSTGLSTGRIRIQSNDPDEATREITLNGYGVTPPVAEITPGFIEIKMFSAERKVVYIKLRNTGGETMLWNLGEGIPYYSSIDPYSGSIAPNQERSLRLVIDAMSLSYGTYDYNIRISYNSPVQPQVQIPVIVQVVENHPPFVANAIGNQLLGIQTPVRKMNLAENFGDEDNEPLRYSVAVDENFVTAAILGSELSLSAEAVGEANVTVWATDAMGERADIVFKVVVASVTGTVDEEIVTGFGNHPNPFAGGTTIRYNLKTKSHVQVVVRDVTGRQVDTVVNEEQPPGEKNIDYMAENIRNGMYFYHLIVNGKPSGTGKMVKQ